MTTLLLLLLDLVDRIGQFLDAGGPVLLVIGGAIALMWLLIAERWLYLRRALPRLETRTERLWLAREDHHSWHAHQIRRALIAEVALGAQRYLPAIKTLVAVCPLFGLLGTVTGMIAVFDVMASVGMGNPRLMASGVSQATIPTMAGMVGALSGLFAVHYLESTAKRRIELLGDHLTLSHTLRTPT